jgi:hypothetical protein
VIARARRAKQDPPAIRPAGRSRRSGRQPVEHAGLGERREAVRHSPVLDDAAVHDTAYVDHGEVHRPAAGRRLPDAGVSDADIARWLELGPRYGLRVVGPPIPEAEA